MSGYNAVTTVASALEPGFLRKACVLFDKIYVNSFFTRLALPRSRGNLPLTTDQRAELVFLLREGVIADATDLLRIPECEAYYRDVMLRYLIPPKNERSMAISEIADFANTGACRAVAAAASATTNNETVAISNHWSTLTLPHGGREKAAHVVLKCIPHPAQETPWEVIQEMREDHDLTAAFFRLKHWMNEVSRSDRSARELEDELHALVADYEQYIRIHRARIYMGSIEAVVVTSADILENLIKIKWSTAAKALFAVRARRITLLEAELKAPAREVAYVFEAVQRLR